MTDNQSPRLSGTTPPDDDSPVLGGQAATLHLVEMLQADDEATRRRAVFQLAERGHVAVIEHLRKLAVEGDRSVRQRVAWSLGYLTVPAARDLLLDMALDDAEWIVRQTAGRMLRRYPVVDVLPSLEAALRDDDRAEHAMQALSHLRHDGAGALLVRYITSGSPQPKAVMEGLRAIGAYQTEATYEAAALYVGINNIIEVSAITALWQQNHPKAVALLRERFTVEGLDKDVRKQLIYALGHMSDRATAEALTPAFIEQLTTGEKYVRQAVISVLGLIATPDALHALATYAGQEDDWFNRVSLGRALAPYLTDDLRATLRGYITEGSTDNRLNVLSVLTEVPDPAFDPDLLALFATLDADDEDHQTLLRRVAELVHDVDFLRGLLDHPLEDVRGGALVRLAELGEGERLPAALRGEAPYPMWRAIVAARELGDAALVPALLEAEAEGLSENDTGLWLRAVATCGNEEAIPRIMAYLEHKVVDHRAYAAYALGELGVGEAVPQLMHMASSDAHPWGARDGAEALGKIGDERALPLLRHMAAHHYGYDGRKSAIIALGRMRDSGALDVLTGALRWDNQAANRAAAAEALGLIGEEGAQPALVAALSAGHGDERFAAVEALGRLGAPPPEVAPLAERDPHRRIREAAQRIL